MVRLSGLSGDPATGWRGRERNGEYRVVVVVEEGVAMVGAVVVVKDHIEDITVEGNQAAATVDKGLATGDTMVKRMNRWKASKG